MDDYEIITRLGCGSFAEVYKAVEKKTGQLVAIKKLKKKYTDWSECVKLREVKSLERLQDEKLSKQKGSENVIRLKRILLIDEDCTLYLIFEYMEKDLFETMKQRNSKKFNESQIRCVVWQTLLGLSFMHKYGFFHRDMKPENLLINGEAVKIADFGLAREIRSVPPYTEYISTRYYRAPECILKSTNYNSPVDVWAVGCIMAEMYLHPFPLFFGNNEKEVLFRICSVLGTPNHTTWAEGIQLAKKIDLKFPVCQATPLAQIIPDASKDAIDLMYEMLRWDPNKRATANNLLQHPFFTNYPVPNRISTPEYSITASENKKGIKTYTTNKNVIGKIQTNRVGNANANINANANDTDEISFIQPKKEDEMHLSQILNDTEGFDKLITKLKNEQLEEEIEMENNKNLLNSPSSPIEGEFDFDIEKAFKENPMLTSNTLYLGNSGNLESSNSFLNKNITNINKQTQNETLYDYSNKNFFDSSIMNKINSGITMTTMINCNDDQKGSEGTCTVTLVETFPKRKNEEKDEQILRQVGKISTQEDKGEMDFDNCNVQLKKEPPSGVRKRSAYRFIEESLKEGSNCISLASNGKQEKKDQTSPKGNGSVTITSTTSPTAPVIIEKKCEFESRRKKNVGNANSILFSDLEKNIKSSDSSKQETDHVTKLNSNANNLNKLLDKDMIIDSSHSKKGYSCSHGTPIVMQNSGNSNGSNMFGIVESRRHINIGSYNNISTSKVGMGNAGNTGNLTTGNTGNSGTAATKDKGRNFMKI